MFICKKAPITVRIYANYYIVSGFAHCWNSFFSVGWPACEMASLPDRRPRGKLAGPQAKAGNAALVQAHQLRFAHLNKARPV